MKAPSPDEAGLRTPRRRVLLANPPADHGVRQVREGRCMQRAGAWTAVWTPISLAYCAAVLRDAGAEVALRDCIVEEIDFRQLAGIVADFRPDLVVLNVVTPSVESDLSTAEWIKCAHPAARIAAIGIHGTALPDSCFAMQKALDFVVRGEPEFTVRDLALGGLEDPGRVAGVSWARNGNVAHNPDRPFIADLDALPFPAWDLIQRDRYLMPFTEERFLLVGTGRGCPFRCRFCADSAYYGKAVRLRSPVRVADELERNLSEYGIGQFLFWSESFTLNRPYAAAVADEIARRRLPVRWVCNSRVDQVDADLLERFARAGCWMIGYGIESGSQEILDAMRKGTTLEQAAAAVAMAKQAGLQVTAHCVLGFPGETRETAERGIEFVIALDVDFAQFYCAVPFPGSELYADAEREGWISSRDWRRFEQNFSVLTTPTLAAEETMELRRLAYRRFYMRPRTVWRTLRRVGNWGEAKRLAGMVRDFLTWV